MKYIFLFLAIILLSTSPAEAQFDGDLIADSAFIAVSPENPEPNASFTATLDDYSIPGQTTSISWRINNVAMPEFNNLRSVNLVNTGAGKSLLVEAIITRNNGVSLSLTKRLTPLYLDLIIEPQTRTPAFYLGKGLLSTDSNFNVSAIISGTNLKPQDLIYTWKINDDVVDGGSIRGKNIISTTAPQGKVFLIQLEVSKTNGDVLVSRTVTVQNFSPEVKFYEKSSLYGISHRPISVLDLIGNSASIVAEPYNLDIKTYNNPPLLEWEVDGKKTTNTTGNPYEITLARPAGGFSGTSNIDFHVRNLTDLLQGAKGQFRIKF